MEAGLGLEVEEAPKQVEKSAAGQDWGFTGKGGSHGGLPAEGRRQCNFPLKKSCLVPHGGSPGKGGGGRIRIPPRQVRVG